MAARKASKKRMSVKKATPAKRKVYKGTKRSAAKPVASKSKKSSARTSSARSSGPVSVGRKPFSKSQLIAELVTRSGVSRKEVVAVLELIPNIIEAHLQKSGPESFSWPGLFKIIVIKKPATKARQGINPFTGESMMFKAKPASRRVKVRPLKSLKEMAG